MRGLVAFHVDIPWIVGISGRLIYIFASTQDGVFDGAPERWKASFNHDEKPVESIQVLDFIEVNHGIESRIGHVDDGGQVLGQKVLLKDLA